MFGNMSQVRILVEQVNEDFQLILYESGTTASTAYFVTELDSVDLDEKLLGAPRFPILTEEVAMM